MGVQLKLHVLAKQNNRYSTDFGMQIDNVVFHNLYIEPIEMVLIKGMSLIMST